MEVKNERLEDHLSKSNFTGGRSTWSQNRQKLDYIFSKTKKYFCTAEAICDIGIGEGYMLRRYHRLGKKVTGIDISQFSIEHLTKVFAEENRSIDLIHADLSKMTPVADRFDIITCFDILEHIPTNGFVPAIESLKTMLKPGGYLIGSLPLGEDLSASIVVCPKCSHEFHRVGHFHSFATFDEIQKKITPDLRIIASGEAPYTWFKSNFLNSLLTFSLNFVKKIAQRKFDTTAYFVAQLKK